MPAYAPRETRLKICPVLRADHSTIDPSALVGLCRQRDSGAARTAGANVSPTSRDLFDTSGAVQRRNCTHNALRLLGIHLNLVVQFRQG